MLADGLRLWVSMRGTEDLPLAVCGGCASIFSKGINLISPSTGTRRRVRTPQPCNTTRYLTRSSERHVGALQRASLHWLRSKAPAPHPVVPCAPCSSHTRWKASARRPADISNEQIVEARLLKPSISAGSRLQPTYLLPPGSVELGSTSFTQDLGALTCVV